MCARTVVALRHLIVLAWLVATVAALVVLPDTRDAGSGSLGDIVPPEAAAVRTEERALRLFGTTVATDTAVVERNAHGLSGRAMRDLVATAVAVTRHERRIPGVLAAVPLVNLRPQGLPWR